ncbi:MAG: D-alanine--D-alanine ligase [Patescibacteria group bacterium]
MKKLNIIVLVGGTSSEHEISLISGQQVVKNLSNKKYNVTPVLISKKGVWQFSVDDLKKMEVGVVFIAMHGTFAEDGTIQGLLELSGLKYTGAGVLVSALGMNKLMFRKFLNGLSFPVPKYVSLKRHDSLNKVFKILRGPPYFVKPNSQGSSVGASIVKTKKNLAPAVKNAFKYDDIVLVDEYIKGIELTCAVLGNENPKVLPLVEIVPKKGEFFDYESKYTESGSEEIAPARISKKLTKEIQEIAIKVYKEIGCRGFGRVDFILKGTKPYILEINTIPGLTPMSLFPKAAKAAGISYPKLLDKIIGLAL